MKFCVSQFQNLLAYASDEIKNNIEVIYTGLISGSGGRICKYISNELKDNKEFVKKIYTALEFASDRLKDNDETVGNAIIINASLIKYASDRIKNNRTLAFQYLEYEINKNGIKDYSGYSFFIKNIGLDLKNDIEFITKFLELEEKRLMNENYSYSNSFEHIGQDLKNNREIIIKILDLEKIYYLHCKKNAICYFGCNIYEYIGDLFKKDTKIIKKCLELDGTILKQLPFDYRLTKQCIMLAFNSIDDSLICHDYYVDILEIVPPKYQKDKEIVIKAVTINGNNYFYASKKLKEDIDVIVTAINHCSYDIDESTKSNKYNHLVEMKALINKILSCSKYNNNNLPNRIRIACYNKIMKNI